PPRQVRRAHRTPPGPCRRAAGPREVRLPLQPRPRAGRPARRSRARRRALAPPPRRRPRVELRRCARARPDVPRRLLPEPRPARAPPRVVSDLPEPRLARDAAHRSLGRAARVEVTAARARLRRFDATPAVVIDFADARSRPRVRRRWGRTAMG